MYGKHGDVFFIDATHLQPFQRKPCFKWYHHAQSSPPPPSLDGLVHNRALSSHSFHLQTIPLYIFRTWETWWCNPFVCINKCHFKRNRQTEVTLGRGPLTGPRYLTLLSGPYHGITRTDRLKSRYTTGTTHSGLSFTIKERSIRHRFMAQRKRKNHRICAHLPSNARGESAFALNSRDK